MDFDTTPIVGWRCWTVSQAGGRLRSITWKECDWPCCEPITAQCMAGMANYMSGEGPCETPPTCERCGIYAFKYPAPAVQWLLRQESLVSPYHKNLGYGTVRVMGQVSLWGKVIRHQFGYRAQFAYPYSMMITKPSLCRVTRRELQQLGIGLSSAYGVEAEVVDEGFKSP